MQNQTDSPDKKEKRVTHCRSCGARIIMCVNNNTQKAAPINASPDPEGNITIDFPEELHIAPTYTVHVGEEKLTHIRNLNTVYKSHFSTCPEAKKWRKRND